MPPFSSDWIEQLLGDPFAVLGIPVTADDLRVKKRYWSIAKRLHPDQLLQANPEVKEFAETLLKKIVNPSYERIRDEKGRRGQQLELKTKIRQLSLASPWTPKTEAAQRLRAEAAANVDGYYEQAVSRLSESQYDSLEKFSAVVAQLADLNLVYYQLKRGDGFIGEKRVGVVPVAKAQPIQTTPVPKDPRKATETYDRRHYRRAYEYMRTQNWVKAIQELRDAIQIKADEADYHALLGVAYHCNRMDSMARVYLRQALRLRPDHPMALKYATRAGLDPKNLNPSLSSHPAAQPVSRNRVQPPAEPDRPSVSQKKNSLNTPASQSAFHRSVSRKPTWIAVVLNFFRLS